ncbi:MAG: alpha/beta fold hydrolase [bacterium]
MSEFYYSKKKKKPFILIIFEYIFLFAFSYFVVLPCFIHFSGLENYLLYKPAIAYQSLLPELKNKYSEVKIKTKDKQSLYGWYFKPNKNRPTILYFYKTEGNISNYQKVISSLVSNGYGLMALDYRGFGKSTGSPSQEKLYEDSITAYKYLKEKQKAKNIIVYGDYIGSSIALNLANINPVKAVILQNPFTSVRDIIIEISKTAKLSKYPQVKEVNIRFFQYLPIWQNFDSTKNLSMLKNRNILLLSSTKEKEITPLITKYVKDKLKTSELYFYTSNTNSEINSFKSKLLIFLSQHTK